LPSWSAGPIPKEGARISARCCSPITVSYPVPSLTGLNVPTLVAAAGERASMRFLEFFAANIRNPHTRRAYARAADEFLAWCAGVGVLSPPAACQKRRLKESRVLSA
jgi:hypothetical protein